VVLELRDGMDGGLGPGVSQQDLRRLDLDANHPLTGPILVRGAGPGDVLEVETLEIEPAGQGFTAVIPGFGLLGDRFTEPFLVRWEIAGGVARSADLPGVAIRGAPFLGSIGVAPSHELLERARRREAAVAERGGLRSRPRRAARSR
jgi:formamidase